MLLKAGSLTSGAAEISFEAIALLPAQGILTIEKVDARMRNYIRICRHNHRLYILEARNRPARRFERDNPSKHTWF